jgi:hypothetical protein
MTRKSVTSLATALIVSKNIIDPEISLEEDAIIVITIENVEDTVIYDVNVTETVFEIWSFTIHGITSLAYNKIDPGESVSHTYAMRPLKEGNYTLKPVVITYYDQPISVENRLEYKSRSNELAITVYKPLKVDELPLFLLNMFSIVAIVYIVFITINTLSIRKNRKADVTLVEGKLDENQSKENN